MAIENALIAAFFRKEMMLLRFIILASVVVAIGFCVPTRAMAANNAATPSAWNSDIAEKADKPPRPRPKPGPKDGGEDE